MGKVRARRKSFLKYEAAVAGTREDHLRRERKREGPYRSARAEGVIQHLLACRRHNSNLTFFKGGTINRQIIQIAETHAAAGQKNVRNFFTILFLGQVECSILCEVTL